LGLRARLRLDLPEHPEGRWPLQLELVDWRLAAP
jgi:hypothetical protein